jgi:iron-sulfur cluster assembly accessory protein
MLEPRVTLTPAAQKFMRRLVRFSDHPTGGFRLSVSPGGCSGFNSVFTVEPEPLSNDAVLQVDGLQVFLPAESRLLLDGVTVDFTETALQSGLAFINPNSQAACCSTATPSDRPVLAAVSLSSIKRK